MGRSYDERIQPTERANVPQFGRFPGSRGNPGRWSAHRPNRQAGPGVAHSRFRTHAYLPCSSTTARLMPQLRQRRARSLIGQYTGSRSNCAHVKSLRRHSKSSVATEGYSGPRSGTGPHRAVTSVLKLVHQYSFPLALGR